jgi:hypothetical protein
MPFARALRPSLVKRLLRLRRQRPLDLGRGHAHAVAFLQDGVPRHRLAVDADEIVGRLAVGELLGEQLLDSDGGLDFDVIGEARAVVVDLC